MDVLCYDVPKERAMRSSCVASILHELWGSGESSIPTTLAMLDPNMYQFSPSLRKSEAGAARYNSVEVLLGVPSCYPTTWTRLDLRLRTIYKDSSHHDFCIPIRKTRARYLDIGHAVPFSIIIHTYKNRL